MPDIAFLLTLVGRRLKALLEILVKADNNHETELADDAAPRDARDRCERFGYLLLEARPQGAARDRQRDRHGDVAAVDLNVAHHVELGHRSSQLGVDDLLERLQDLVVRRIHPNEPS